MGTEEVKKELDHGNWSSNLPFDQWTVLPTSGPRPAARYKHAATVVDEKLYIVGGSRNGRYLSDVQVFDFRNVAWSTVKVARKLNEQTEESSLQADLPAIAGHHMIKWRNKLLLVGGHLKESFNNLTVRFIDLDTHENGVIETSGDVPIARGGHSVTLSGSKMIIFGGEDKNRRLLNDVHVLDLDTMAWKLAETTQTPPSPRYDHTAAVHAGRYFLVFSGCSHSIFYNDLHVLDFQTMEWSQPEIQGDFITPRAGHAGITVEDSWYIVGGGDNKSGAAETLILNMSKRVCSVLTSVKERDPLASEGLSVSLVFVNGQQHLVSFGGYNGRYSNEIYVMKLKSRDSSPPRIFQSPAAAAAAASVTAAYAVAKPENVWPSEENSGSRESEINGSQKELTTEISSIREENKVLESAVAGVTAENSMLQRKIDEINVSHAELSKELHSVQGQLVAERSRCSKLEAQIAELQKLLESLPSVENEVEILRSQKSALEQNVELADVQRQSSGGVLKWIYGGST